MQKTSIRFFDDREVRAVWDEENAKWWFNVIDIVAILNEQDDYTKANNYWRWLKRKLKSENSQLVSATHGFKFIAADGKKRLSDTLDSAGVIELAKNFPNTNKDAFLTECGVRMGIHLLPSDAILMDCYLCFNRNMMFDRKRHIKKYEYPHAYPKLDVFY